MDLEVVPRSAEMWHSWNLYAMETGGVTVEMVEVETDELWA
jgi:hypothetical protein